MHYFPTWTSQNLDPKKMLPEPFFFFYKDCVAKNICKMLHVLTQSEVQYIWAHKHLEMSHTKESPVLPSVSQIYLTSECLFP